MKKCSKNYNNNNTGIYDLTPFPLPCLKLHRPKKRKSTSQSEEKEKSALKRKKKGSGAQYVSMEYGTLPINRGAPVFSFFLLLLWDTLPIVIIRPSYTSSNVSPSLCLCLSLLSVSHRAASSSNRATTLM